VTEACATCRFWKADPWSRGSKHTDPPYQGEPTQGWCRRWPPHPDNMPSEMPFPITAPEVWCGEYSQSSGISSEMREGGDG